MAHPSLRRRLHHICGLRRDAIRSALPLVILKRLLHRLLERMPDNLQRAPMQFASL
jgi:hypothetical protein